MNNSLQKLINKLNITNKNIALQKDNESKKNINLGNKKFLKKLRKIKNKYK